MAPRTAIKGKNNSLSTADAGLTPDIGLSDKTRSISIDLLTTSLANTFVLYTKTRKFHWNVVGMHFMELHRLFEDQYEALHDSMDEIAERIRQLGGVAIGTTMEMGSCSILKESPGVNPDEKGMVRELLEDHETVIQSLREAADKTEETGDMGTNDFLIGLMEDHEKTAWLLRAHLG